MTTIANSGKGQRPRCVGVCGPVPRLQRINHDDWQRIGTELFGADMRLWRFRCPGCGHEQSHAEVKSRNPDIGDTSTWIAYACEGRRNPDVGCDWTLGGLLKIHAVEVFRAGRLRPVFEFAHEQAPELVAAAAARFTAPEHPTTEAKTWVEYTWPDWIPESVRGPIAKFWAESCGRGPHEWLRDAKAQGAPVLGSTVELPLLLMSNELIAGRYIHCWNNIGRVLAADGTVHCVSF